MKIKIIKCHDASLWYAGRVGEVFDVVESSVNHKFWVVKNTALLSRLRHAVRKTDCRPVKGEAQKTPRQEKKKVSVSAKRSHNTGMVQCLCGWNILKDGRGSLHAYSQHCPIPYHSNQA